MTALTTKFATSSDGTRISFATTGHPDLPSIVLIHGWAQQFICWQPVLDRLSDRFHIVALDLRGHGGSDKPDTPEAYTDTACWGDDVAAVIAAAGVRRPVLVGWSYGSRVIAAYLDTHGEGAIAGVLLAGGIIAIGAAREDWMVGPSSPGLDRDLYTEDAARRIAATARFVAGCTKSPLDPITYAELVGANMLCPAHVRRALFGATVDFRPVFGAMSVPGLVIHGAVDTVVTPATGQAAAALMSHGRYVAYENVGHAPFLEDADRFADDLAHFVEACR